MLLLPALVLALSAFRGLQAAEFRAAVVKVDITPDTPQMLRGYSPRMSTKVHDRLYHRIVALDDGTTSFFLISSDLCSLSPAFCDRVTGNLAKELGLPPENIWWSITHTHSSPYVGPPGVPGLFMPNRFQFPVDETYTALVEKTLADGVRQARQKLEPARLGVGRGYAEANINRRARDADGQVRLGLNPSGPVDRRIGLVRLDKADGTPLALLANYAMHGTVLGGACTVVSADGPGIVAEYVEEKTGAAMLYLNGAAGNIAPLYSTRTEAEIKLLGRFKVLLGDPILDANRRLRATTAEVKLRASRIIVETPKRPGLHGRMSSRTTSALPKTARKPCWCRCDSCASTMTPSSGALPWSCSAKSPTRSATARPLPTRSTLATPTAPFATCPPSRSTWPAATNLRPLPSPPPPPAISARPSTAICARFTPRPDDVGTDR